MVENQPCVLMADLIIYCLAFYHLWVHPDLISIDFLVDGPVYGPYSHFPLCIQKLDWLG